MKRGRKAKCPYCGSSRTRRKGFRKTATMGDRPLKYCNDCGRKFTLGRKSESTIIANPLPQIPSSDDTNAIGAALIGLMDGTPKSQTNPDHDFKERR